MTRRAASQPAGRLVVALLGLVAGTALLVLAGWHWHSAPTDVGSVPALSSSPGPPDPVPRAPVPQAFRPDGVRITAQQVDAAVVAVDVQPDGLLAVPEEVRTVGWWSAGAAAGSASGTVVLVGHVDSARQGAGAFFRLRELQPGARVTLTGAAGESATYVVTARRQYPKAALPAQEVFGQGRSPRLVLLTCGGSFADGHYRDNVVVYAVPAPAAS